MAGNIKSITNPRLSLNILSDQDVSRIHTATLDIIENVGIRFPSKKVLDLWEAHGASVDHSSMVVKAPGQLWITAAWW
jgi:trimethylamine--corrinoid protein Co-methyltransferase